MRKLVIFLLFIVFTLLAVGFVSIPGFKFATQLKVGEKPVELYDAEQAIIIDIPFGQYLAKLVSKDQEVSNLQVVIIHDGTAGYIELLADPVGIEEMSLEELAAIEQSRTYTEAEAILANVNYVHSSAVYMWFFFLILCFLIPTRRSKKKIKKLARIEAEDVVDEELDNMAPPARAYAPAPRRAPAPRGGRRHDLDEEDDYEY